MGWRLVACCFCDTKLCARVVWAVVCASFVYVRLPLHSVWLTVKANEVKWILMCDRYLWIEGTYHAAGGFACKFLYLHTVLHSVACFFRSLHLATSGHRLCCTMHALKLQWQSHSIDSIWPQHMLHFGGEWLFIACSVFAILWFGVLPHQWYMYYIYYTIYLAHTHICIGGVESTICSERASFFLHKTLRAPFKKTHPHSQRIAVAGMSIMHLLIRAVCSHAMHTLRLPLKIQRSKCFAVVAVVMLPLSLILLAHSWSFTLSLDCTVFATIKVGYSAWLSSSRFVLNVSTKP